MWSSEFSQVVVIVILCGTKELFAGNQLFIALASTESIRQQTYTLHFGMLRLRLMHDKACKTLYRITVVIALCAAA